MSISKLYFSFITLLLSFVIYHPQIYGAVLTFDDPTDCDLSVDVPDDFHVCFDEEFSLGGIIIGDYDDYIWYENGNETNYDLDEEISIDATTSFTLIAFYESEDNIIINGDFEGGDSDFTTDYVIGTTSCFGLGNLDCEGTYDVIDDPSDGHDNFDACSDVIGGGNMMVVNGAASLQEIWCQEVCVEPGATYVFSAWAASVNPNSPAQLQFAIEGELIGSLFSLTSSTCDWEEFEAEWTSSNETTVEICVTNQNTAAGGNDFALDGIGFVRVCQDEATFTVTQSEFETEFNDPVELTCTTTESEIVVSVMPSNDYSYDWSTDEGLIVEYEEDNQIVIVNAPGVYTVTVTDIFGCSLDYEIEIEEDIEYPELTIESSNDLDCTQNLTELEVDANYGGIDFEWYNSTYEFISDDNSIVVSEGGTYYVLGFDDDTGCETLDSIFIAENFEEFETQIISSNNLDCNNTTSIISITSPYSLIEWFDMDTTSLGTSTNITINQEGTYYANITFENGCSTTDSITVLYTNPIFEYSINFDSIINCYSPTSNITISIDTFIYTFNWLTQNVNQLSPFDFEVSLANYYVFEIIDTSDCIYVDSIFVAADFTPPAINFTPDSITCTDPIANLSIENPTGELTIDWFINNSLYTTSDSLNVDQESFIQYIVTAPNGCTAEGEFDVLSNASVPTVSIKGDTLNCTKTIVELVPISAANNLMYNWQYPNGTSSSEATIQTAQSGLHTLSITNELGCQASTSYMVEIDTIKPQVILPDLLILNCNNPSLSGTIEADSLTADILTVGNWLNSDDLTYFINEPGEYNINAIGYNGCSSSEKIVTLIDTLSPIILLNNIQSLDCNTTEFDLSIEIINPFETLIWNNNVIPNDDLVQSITMSGTYAISAIAANGCQSSTEIEITQSEDIPQFDIIASTIDCNNPYSTVEIIIANAYTTFSISNNSSSISNALTFETQESDTIYVKVTNALGCTTIKTLLIDFDTIAPNFELDAKKLTCNLLQTNITIESQDNILHTEVYDNNGLYIGDINTPITVAGLYTVTCMSANGCSKSKAIEIIEETDYPTIENFITQDFICESGLEISQLEISGGRPPYIVLVDGDELSNTTDSFSIRTQGQHTIEVIDANGCLTDTLIIIEPILPLITSVIPEVSINQGDLFQFELDFNKPEEEIEIIEWQPQQYLNCYDCTSPIYSGNEDITYSIYVRDKMGCESTTQVSVKLNIEVKYYIPNVFALNTFENNKFTIYDNDEDISNIIRLNIYDRWGNLVSRKENFPPNNPNLGWDGRYNDNFVEGGVYVYHFILELKTGDIVHESGDITFIK